MYLFTKINFFQMYDRMSECVGVEDTNEGGEIDEMIMPGECMDSLVDEQGNEHLHIF